MREHSQGRPASDHVRAREAQAPSAAPPTEHPALALQRSAGNLAVGALIARAQAKTEVSAADDPLERRADDVADHVVRALLGPAASGGDPTDRASSGQPPPTVQRVAAAGAAGGTLDGETDRALGRARSGGAPLAPDLQRSVGDAMGADLSGVRVHAGPVASDLAQDLGATAFTVGSDVFFRDAVPDTSTPAGLRLMSHELAHTVQQGASPSVQRAHAGQELVQRVFGDDFNWSSAGSMTRSGTGAEGVLFVTSPGRRIVVKFLAKAAGADQADRMLRDAGVEVPDSSVVRNTDSDTVGREIRATVQGLLGTLDDAAQAQVTQQMASYGYIQLQDMQAAKPLDALTGPEVATFLADPALLHEVGRIAAIDSFLGNTDRLSQKTVNTGNYMLRDTPAGPTLVAIDNELHAAYAKNDALRESEVRFVISDAGADLVASSFINRLTKSFQLHVPSDGEMDTAKSHIVTGIRAGADEIIRLVGTQQGFIDDAKRVEKEQLPGPDGTKTKQREVVRKTLHARAAAMRDQLTHGQLAPVVPAV